MNILIIRVSATGDIIQTLPSLGLIRYHYPKARVTWVVQKKAASVLINHPLIDECIILPDNYLTPCHWRAMWRVLKRVRSKTWDAIIDYQGLLKTSFLIAFLTGKKFGFAPRHARCSFTSLLTHHHDTPVYRNIIQKNLSLTSFVMGYLGRITSSPRVDRLQEKELFFYGAKQQDIVAEWLNEQMITSFVIVSPNTSWQSKLWPQEYWEHLISQLLHSSHARMNRSRVVIIGAHDGVYAKAVAERVHHPRFVIAPLWDLVTIGALIDKADLLIAPDTGMLHIADFLKTQTLGIFGPTRAVTNGPFLTVGNGAGSLQVNCPHYYEKTHGKEQNTMPKGHCMYTLMADTVYLHGLRLLEKKAP